MKYDQHNPFLAVLEGFFGMSEKYCQPLESDKILWKDKIISINPMTLPFLIDGWSTNGPCF